MNRHILQRKDPRVQLTQNPDTSEPTISTDIKNSKILLGSSIITPTKKAVPWFVELLEKVEQAMMDDYLFGYITPEYKTFLSPFILHPFEWELGEKVKYADVFSALIEAKIEDRAGNHFFHEN